MDLNAVYLDATIYNSEGAASLETVDGRCLVAYVAQQKQPVTNNYIHSLYRLHFEPAELMAQWTTWLNVAGGYEWLQEMSTSQLVVMASIARKVDYVSDAGQVDRGIIDVKAEWVPGYDFDIDYAPGDPRLTRRLLADPDATPPLPLAADAVGLHNPVLL